MLGWNFFSGRIRNFFSRQITPEPEVDIRAESSWAGIEAKRREKPKKEEPEAVNDDGIPKWEEYSRRNREDTDGFRKFVVEDQEQLRAVVGEDIRAHHVTVAFDSTNTDLMQMQIVINELVKAYGDFDAPPKLLLHSHKSRHAHAQKSYASVSTQLPEFIDLNEDGFHYFRKHMDQFKAAMAHELAHINNGDCSVDGMIANETKPENQKMEVLADRKAAIIFGNPKEYAKLSKDFSFQLMKDHKIEPHEYKRKYLSANGNARMLKKWADILESKGATNAEGNIIKESALDVFKDSRDLTEGILKESLRFGLHHPRPYEPPIETHTR